MRTNALPIPSRPLLAGCLLAATVTLSACSSTPPKHAYTDAQVTQSMASLQQLQAHYDSGDYGSVIRRAATDATLQDAPQDIRIQALKLQAFSLCLREHAFLCKDRFRQILALQPDFQLSASEDGHPLWGPVFQQARQEQS